MHNKGIPPKRTMLSTTSKSHVKVTSQRTYSKYYDTPATRQQCKANQARYRNKQQDFQLQLEVSIGSLRQEVDILKRRRQKLTAREKSNGSPWLVVARVFDLLESCLRFPWDFKQIENETRNIDVRRKLAVLEKSFAYDVAMGDTSGVNALLQQLRRYSQYFMAPQIRLKSMDMKVPGVVMARASLSLTITELTLRHVFPGMAKAPRSKYDIDWGQRLLGQRLDCSCSLDFLFDEDTGQVVRLEANIGLIPAIFRVLRSLDCWDVDPIQTTRP